MFLLYKVGWQKEKNMKRDTKEIPKYYQPYKNTKSIATKVVARKPVVA
jgi:hypothetical protein